MNFQFFFESIGWGRFLEVIVRRNMDQESDVYQHVVNLVEGFHWKDQLRLYHHLKGQVKDYSTSSIKNLLLQRFPEYDEIIEDIIYIRPYTNDLTKECDPITMPSILLDDGDVINWRYSNTFGTYGELICYVESKINPEPTEHANLYIEFGRDVFDTLLHADLL